MLWFFVTILSVIPIAIILISIDEYLTKRKINYLFLEKSKNDKYIDIKRIINKAKNERPDKFKLGKSTYIKKNADVRIFISEDNKTNEILWFLVDPNIKQYQAYQGNHVILKEKSTGLYYLAEINNKPDYIIGKYYYIISENVGISERKDYLFIGRLIE